MKLTAATVRSLKVPAGKSEAIFFDDDVPGFGLPLREHGSRTWVFQYKLGAKQRRMTLGSANAITVEKARKGYRNKDGKDVPGAEQLHARVKLGQDPASDKAEAQALAAQTFAAAVA
jgi:hypothetical protein